MKKQNQFQFSKAQKEQMSLQIRKYLEEDFDLEIGNLQAEIFVDFIAEKLGSYFYNEAVKDSISFLTEKTDDLYALMKEKE